MKNESFGQNFFKISLLIFLMFIASINYNIFINPAKIVAGGTNGISIIVERLLGIDPSISILIFYSAILMIAFLFSEFDLAFSAVLSSISYPLFIKLTSSMVGTIKITNGDMLIIAIFSGMISGLVAGITCKNNISQGGIVLISQIVNKKFKKSTSLVNFLINAIIVVIGGLLFGITNILYAIVFLYVNKIVMDKIILGTSQNKLFQIVTTKDEEITKYITNELNVGVTTFDIKGGLSEKKKKLIMTSVSNRDYFRLKEGIHEIDNDVFIVVTDSYQVKGGK